MTFETVFDASRGTYGFWDGPTIGAAIIAIALVIVFVPVGKRTRTRLISGYALLGGSCLWTAVAVWDIYVQSRIATNIMKAQQYDIVEGAVTDFVPMPYAGHSVESFVVDGRRFSYSDFVATAGFHNTASHGGPIREGLYVKVTYKSNLILRLEIAR